MTTINYTLKHTATLAIAIAVLFVATFAQASSDDDQRPFRGKAFQRAKNVKARAMGVPSTACTADAKVCEDGTSVGRRGPNCEFAQCPGEGRKHKARNVFKRLKEDRDEAVKDWRAEKREVRGEIKDLRGHVRERRDEVRDTVKAKRAEVKDALKAADTPEERRAILKDAKKERADFRAKIKEERKELRAKVKGKISEHMQHVLKRLTAMHDRLSKLNTRIQSYIDELTAKGVDTAKAQGYLDTAKSKVATANEQIRAAKALIEEAVSSDKPAEYRQKVREAIRSAVQATKDAKKSIKDAVRAAKQAATS